MSDPRDTDNLEYYLELCALSVLGGIEPDEQRLLDARLAQGCPECEAELERCGEFAAELAETATPLAPRAEVKQQLFDRIDAIGDAKNVDATAPVSAPEVASADSKSQPWREWERDDGRDERTLTDELFFKAKSDGDWEPTGVEGIEVRSLFVDRANDRMTALFRMEAGTSYVPHRHAGYEECFVVEGDLRVGDIVMQAGDFQRAAEGSIHGEQSTENGCVLLISSSLTDEIV